MSGMIDHSWVGHKVCVVGDSDVRYIEEQTGYFTLRDMNSIGIYLTHEKVGPDGKFELHAKAQDLFLPWRKVSKMQLVEDIKPEFFHSLTCPACHHLIRTCPKCDSSLRRKEDS